MDQKELFDRLEELEWEDFEVKEAKTSIPKSSFETVSAFSNTNGGWLVFGVSQVDKTFKISGVEGAEKIEQDFSTALRGDKFNQKINVRCAKYNLDGKTISDYRTYMENVNREHRYNKLSTEELLEKLQVLVDGRITIGGMLVFGREDNINRMLTDFRIDYLEIMGTSYSDAPTRYSYRLFEEENLFRFYFSIFERLIKKIDLPFTLRTDGFATDNQPQLVAIREALVNLLIFTMPRNPIVTRIFRIIKLAENAGSGFDKMINGWKTYYDEPVVSGGIDYYKITFPLVKAGESSEKTSEKTSEKIILLIRENPAISAKEIAEKVGLSSRAVEMQIAKLKKDNIIKRIGPDKGGMWEVVKK